jgi:hypothetical protein
MPCCLAEGLQYVAGISLKFCWTIWYYIPEDKILFMDFSLCPSMQFGCGYQSILCSFAILKKKMCGGGIQPSVP